MESLGGKQQFGGEGVDDRLPFFSGRVDSKVTGVLVADHQVTELMRGSSPAASRITVQADHSDCQVAVDQRCTFTGKLRDEDEHSGPLAQFHERVNGTDAIAEVLTQPESGLPR